MVGLGGMRSIGSPSSASLACMETDCGWTGPGHQRNVLASGGPGLIWCGVPAGPGGSCRCCFAW